MQALVLHRHVEMTGARRGQELTFSRMVQGLKSCRAGLRCARRACAGRPRPRRCRACRWCAGRCRSRAERSSVFPPRARNAAGGGSQEAAPCDYSVRNGVADTGRLPVIWQTRDMTNPYISMAWPRTPPWVRDTKGGLYTSPAGFGQVCRGLQAEAIARDARLEGPAVSSLLPVGLALHGSPRDGPAGQPSNKGLQPPEGGDLRYPKFSSTATANSTARSRAFR